jgi:hypothetical protein
MVMAPREYWKYYRNKPQAGTWRVAMQELATSVEDTLGIQSCSSRSENASSLWGYRASGQLLSGL